ncbi:chemotaxis protein CheB [Paraburkholderia sp. RCC_158]|uniref:chemotaxis protein CheB n=1 Tax=Paraburkholderia sp. RCC_158 TaxID=3239220 RepID=UPI0035257D18
MIHLSPFLQRCLGNRRGVCSHCSSGNIWPKRHGYGIECARYRCGGGVAWRSAGTRRNPVLVAHRSAASIFVVVHIGAWPNRLSEIVPADCLLPVMHPRDGQRIARATVYVAPPDRHMLMRHGVIVLSTGPKENFAAPGRCPPIPFRSRRVWPPCDRRYPDWKT